MAYESRHGSEGLLVYQLIVYTYSAALPWYIDVYGLAWVRVLLDGFWLFFYARGKRGESLLSSFFCAINELFYYLRHVLRYA